MVKEILIIVPFAFHRESGSSLSTFYRVSALAELSPRIDIITTPHGREINIESVTVKRYPGLKLFRNYEPGQYVKKLIYEPFLLFGTLISLVRKKYEIVIVHGSCIYWAFLIQKLFKTRFIATVHGNIETELDKWGISKNRIVKKISAGIENKIIGTFPIIIAEHDEVKSILIRSGVKSKKIKVIRICVRNVDQIVKDADSEDFTILYTGTFVKVQNLDLLYRTAILLKNEKIRFILIGGNESEVKYEQRRAEGFGVSKLFTILPRVEQKDLEKYYIVADIVVSPREYGHDTPMKIFDYLNYGKCVLATDRKIHTDILNKEVAVLTEPFPEAFAEAILKLKENQSLITEKEKTGKLFFIQNFTFETMVVKYRNLMNDVLEIGKGQW